MPRKEISSSELSSRISRAVIYAMEDGESLDEAVATLLATHVETVKQLPMLTHHVILTCQKRGVPVNEANIREVLG